MKSDHPNQAERHRRIKMLLLGVGCGLAALLFILAGDRLSARNHSRGHPCRN